jgi:hypothetical protein
MEDPLHFYSPQQAAELIAEEDKSLHFTWFPAFVQLSWIVQTYC